MSTQLSVMTWNVRYFGHGSRGVRASESWMRKIAWILAGRDEIPDVLALQEVEDGSLRGGKEPQLARFTDLLHRALAAHKRSERFVPLYFPAHRYAVGDTSLFTTGLAVLVSDRHAIERHNAGSPHDITHVRWRRMEPLKQRRVVAHVRIRPRGAQAVDLLNTHLSLPAFFEGPAPHRIPERMGYGSNQVVEAENLLRWLHELQPRRAVLVGDFNSQPGSPVYERIVRDGLVAAEGEADTVGFLHLRMHIDHLFATPSLSWVATEAHSVGGGPFRGLSDHAPKIGRLRV